VVVQVEVVEVLILVVEAQQVPVIHHQQAQVKVIMAEMLITVLMVEVVVVQVQLVRLLQPVKVVQVVQVLHLLFQDQV
jgi:hypothetical protein